MKIAPLVHEINRHTDIDSVLCHTGQHYDNNLSRVFFEELEIPMPDINLGMGSGTRDEQITRISAAFEPIIRHERPDVVVVVGDVNSTIACARVARSEGVKVAHVEAGLRSFDLTMPEEHNRRETDQISDFLFVTEDAGLQNLSNEKINGACYFVGNVMIDTLIRNSERFRCSTVLADLSLSPNKYFVATFHRPSNVDSKQNLVHLVGTIEAVCAKTTLVLPLHPRTRKSLERYNLLEPFKQIRNLVVTKPLGYLDFLKLVSAAQAAITDSGGIQEETTYLGVPCLTMRDNTERPVTISVGTNVLVGSDRDKLLAMVDQIQNGSYKKGQIPQFWDGKTATRIIRILKEELLRT